MSHFKRYWSKLVEIEIAGICDIFDLDVKLNEVLLIDKVVRV